MEIRNWIKIGVTVIGLGGASLFAKAKWLADLVAIYHLPSDLGELLMKASLFPEILTLSFLLIGLGGLAFLIYDTIKDRPPRFIRGNRMVPFIGMIVFGFGFCLCLAWYV